MSQAKEKKREVNVDKLPIPILANIACGGIAGCVAEVTNQS